MSAMNVNLTLKDGYQVLAAAIIWALIMLF